MREMYKEAPPSEPPDDVQDGGWEDDDNDWRSPVRYAVCESCCQYITCMHKDGKLLWCPFCHAPTLRESCPACYTRITWPPQSHCLNCGKPYTLMGIQCNTKGEIEPQAFYKEPSAKARAMLEEGGEHWSDAITKPEPVPPQEEDNQDGDVDAGEQAG